MPLYQFYCKKCEKFIEAIVKLGDYDEEHICPHCKGVLTMLMTPVFFKMN